MSDRHALEAGKESPDLLEGWDRNVCARLCTTSCKRTRDDDAREKLKRLAAHAFRSSLGTRSDTRAHKNTSFSFRFFFCFGAAQLGRAGRHHPSIGKMASTGDSAAAASAASDAAAAAAGNKDAETKGACVVRSCPRALRSSDAARMGSVAGRGCTRGVRLRFVLWLSVFVRVCTRAASRGVQISCAHSGDMNTRRTDYQNKKQKI